MDTRRSFIKKSMLLSGAAGLSAFLPESIQRALAINPDPGSTYLNAEHVVILMQENRSFDHCFGTLKGVRGFNDPRVISLPDRNPAWLQTNALGETYAPFRLNIKDSKVTWMGSLPHSRASQVDANNDGKYDQWLNVKASGNKKYSGMPLTLGYYSRQDLPFNYALADAFTVCDQHFSSAMTSTWPNRLFFWTGTLRDPKDPNGKATMQNDLKYAEANWKTFPERLQEVGVSWNVYQNDLSAGGRYEGEERSWLSNFGCNPLEWFAPYQVRFSSRYVETLQQQIIRLPKEIEQLKQKAATLQPAGEPFEKIHLAIRKKEDVLAEAKSGLEKWSRQKYEQLSDTEKSLHQRAFVKNDIDPDYRKVTKIKYDDGSEERELTIPKGDPFKRFRSDVENKKLPTVSWLVGPQNFSDHPSAPWYGAWYVSEVLDILTKDPEVWKKTIFILTYDENDGYYDHIPPFIPPDSRVPGTGACSKGIDTEIEYVRLERELADGIKKKNARGATIGLGYRVPMIVASPWSRGGKVCSQVFDHTSTLQFLEDFLNKKFKLNIKETNISDWRRTISGDLTSTFSPFEEAAKQKLPFLAKIPFIEEIHKAQFKQEPNGFKSLGKDDIALIKRDPTGSPYMPKQEKGISTACALPYELYAEGKLSKDRKYFEMKMRAGNEIFGSKSKGSPFRIHAPEQFISADKPGNIKEAGRTWYYAVKPGDSIGYKWPVQAFEDNKYHLRTYGPNGFYREFSGSTNDPDLEISCEYERLDGPLGKVTGNVVLRVQNSGDQNCLLEISDHYNKATLKKSIGRGKTATLKFDLLQHHGWYDLSVLIPGHQDFVKRFAGRVETGKEGFTDPAMGGMI